jgi:hypothetical protein
MLTLAMRVIKEFTSLLGLKEKLASGEKVLQIEVFT